MKTYAQKYLPLIIGSALAIGVILGGMLNFGGGTKNPLSSNAKKEKLNRLIDYIDYEYVDSVNTDSIVDVTVNSILTNLDPHSTYIPKRNYEDVAQNMKGDFVGIGINFYKINDTIAVIRPLSGSPSEKAGIEAGDRILYANNIPLFNQELDNDSLTHFLKGKVNSEVTLKVFRKGEKDLLEFQVKRDHIPIKSVDAAYMLSENLGYIKVNRFAETTFDEFNASAEALLREGAKNLVLDLRDNGGGYVEQATQIANEFLKKDQLILFTKNKNNSVKETFSTNGGKFENSKVYVLINENTASASEVIAGALQDNDVGTIIGRRSFGKGLVQREMELGDGSAVRLTVARYYTPTGRSIQRPYTNGSQDYFKDYEKRYRNGELEHRDSIHVNDSLKFKTPKGKIVYGGGGIIPDIFVPKDTDFNKENLTYMLRSGVMDRFIFSELEKDRLYYKSLNLEEFSENFKISEEMVEAYIEYLRSFNFDYHVNKYKDLLQRYLKATIAQQLFGSNAMEKIINQEDPMVNKVLEITKAN
ncbi:S41 family peptidase [Mesonia ostreae]|uniref:S41 family peptidase n=1 Tax=Mesonia ostreae TaxID=861110 RepID=A0ABU2KIT7_9FLAO|nr:S41 family peptidase [Mesonia ostreae]MDT0294594.1 S41 family peptidase [Mesonia ostreae]